MMDELPLRPIDGEGRQMPRSGDAANLIGAIIGRNTHHEVRVTVLGHVHRGAYTFLI